MVFISKAASQEELAHCIRLLPAENPESLLYSRQPLPFFPAEKIEQQIAFQMKGQIPVSFPSHFFIYEHRSDLISKIENLKCLCSVQISAGGELLSFFDELMKLNPQFFFIDLLMDRPLHSTDRKLLQQLEAKQLRVRFLDFQKPARPAKALVSWRPRRGLLAFFWELLGTLSDGAWVFRWHYKYRWMPKLRDFYHRNRHQRWISHPLYVTKTQAPVFYWVFLYPFLKAYWYLEFRLGLKSSRE